jgi:fructose PTS system EIIBC or EIIC component
MQLVEVLRENLVFLKFEAESKDAAIEKFVETVAAAGVVDNAKMLREALFEREKLGTTGVGGGIAIPHARTSAVKDLTVAFFRSTKGIDFAAIDGKPVHLMFLLLAPVSSGGPYLKLLANISRLLRSDEFRSALMDAQNPADVMAAIKDHD